ncbi:MAG: hypothetical protein HRU15_17080 [Planctomycetes bacterium]|nr:hypothetical protein [Planctomycetota bacterium]
MTLRTDEADVLQGKEKSITVDRQVILSGLIGQRDLNGTAAGMHISDHGDTCTLVDADFIWGKQHVTVSELYLREGQKLSGKNWSEEPLLNLEEK